MQLEELQAARRPENITEISAAEFEAQFGEGKNAQQRLSQSWKVFGEAAGQQAVTLYALDPKDVTIGHGACTGWCTVCAMQLVQMRTNGDLSLSSNLKLSDQPKQVAPWLTNFVIKINDVMGAGSGADTRRKELFLPFVDSFAVAENKSGALAKKAGYTLANWAVRTVLPEVLEDSKVNLLEQAETLRNLAEVTNIQTAQAAWSAAQDAREAARGAAWGAARGAARVAWDACDAAQAARYADRDAAQAARYSAKLLGWDRVGELVMPVTANLVAGSVPNREAHLAVAVSNTDVARALEDLGRAA
jgi:hypothetical protein